MSLKTSWQHRARGLARSSAQWLMNARAVPDPHPLLWGLTRDRDGELELGGCSLGDLAGRFGTPLHVVDAARLDSHANRFTACADGSTHPCEVYYSYKTNPVPGVLQLLHRRGIGAEVTSPYELWLAMRLGVEPKAIIYNEPAKTEASMREVIGLDLGLVNLNTQEELAPFAALARQMKRRPRVGIRVAVPFATSGQFGERIDTGAALGPSRSRCSTRSSTSSRCTRTSTARWRRWSSSTPLLTRCWASSTRCTPRWPSESKSSIWAATSACPTVIHRGPLFQRLALATGVDVPMQPLADALSIDAYVREVTQRVDSHFAPLHRRRPRVVLEPGGSMSRAPSWCWAGCCRCASPTPTAWPPGCSISASTWPRRCATSGTKIYALRERPGTSRQRYRLHGPTCTLGDLISPGRARDARRRRLPRGDGLGAYLRPYSSASRFRAPAWCRCATAWRRCCAAARRSTTSCRSTPSPGPGWCASAAAERDEHPGHVGRSAREHSQPAAGPRAVSRRSPPAGCSGGGRRVPARCAPPRIEGHTSRRSSTASSVGASIHHLHCAASCRSMAPASRSVERNSVKLMRSHQAAGAACGGSCAAATACASRWRAPVANRYASQGQSAPARCRRTSARRSGGWTVDQQAAARVVVEQLDLEHPAVPEVAAEQRHAWASASSTGAASKHSPTPTLKGRCSTLRAARTTRCSSSTYPDRL